jgi:4a-hydroxytetrahydrobiopterin dehydratase
MPEKAKDTVYQPEEIRARLAERLPQWRLEDGHLCRSVKTRKWPETVMLFNAVAYLAEEADHHPDATVSYAALELKLMTHSAGGITDKDFALAARIEALVA